MAEDSSENVAECFADGVAESCSKVTAKICSNSFAHSSSDTVADRFACCSDVVAQNCSDGVFAKNCSDRIDEGCSGSSGECRFERVTENLFEAVADVSLENVNIIVCNNFTGITNMNSQ